MSNKILETPVENVDQNHSHKGGPGTYDGEPSMPARTPSPNAVPEKTFDHEGGLPNRQA